jgi:hypothetical protein
MTKCSLVGCQEKVVGGFQEIIDTGNFKNPIATIEGMRTIWCESHKDSLRSHVIGKQGTWLAAKDLN